MTTIAANREVMAADSKCTVDSVSFHTPKIFRKKGALIATAGDCGPGNRFLEWYGSRRKKKPDIGADEDFEALVLTAKGLIYYGKDFEPVPIASGVFAIGSGSVAALTAMKVYGATPEQAVEAACVIDEYTEGPVQVFNLKEVA